jgi:hypothetical protein
MLQVATHIVSAIETQDRGFKSYQGERGFFGLFNVMLFVENF